MPCDSTHPRSALTIELWLRAHRSTVLVTIVALSLMMRGVYFVQLNDGPCLWQHRWDQSDMHFFHTWAGHVADGDILTDRALHPFHDLHRRIAADYFAKYPDDHQRLRAAVEAGAITGSAEQLLWDTWYGGKQFHQEPLYPYLIALTRVVCGDDVRWVFGWQLLCGVLTNAFIYLLARRFFGDLAGACAAAAAVLCGPLMFYELVLLRAAPLTCAGLAAAWAVTTARDLGNMWMWSLAGVLCGVAMLLKSTLILFVLGTLAVLAWELRGQLSHLARTAGALVLGIVVALTPLMIRNVTVGCPPLSSSSVGAVGFILTNAVEWKSTLGARKLAYVGLPEIMHDTGGRFGQVVVATLKTHTLSSYIAQLWNKVSSMLHWYEMPNNTNFYYYAERARILAWMPVRFLLIAPLGLIGVVIGLATVRRSWPLYVLLVNLIIPLVAFGTLSRYRVGLSAVLIVFVGLTCARCTEWIAQRRIAPVAGLAVVALLLAAWVGRPLPRNYPRIHPTDYLAPLTYYYRPLVEEAQLAEDWEEAVRVIGAALSCEPERVRRFAITRPPRTRGDKELARQFGLLHESYAQVLERVGAGDEATRARQRGAFLGRLSR